MRLRGRAPSHRPVFGDDPEGRHEGFGGATITCSRLLTRGLLHAKREGSREGETTAYSEWSDRGGHDKAKRGTREELDREALEQPDCLAVSPGAHAWTAVRRPSSR